MGRHSIKSLEMIVEYFPEAVFQRNAWRGALRKGFARIPEVLAALPAGEVCSPLSRALGECFRVPR